MTKTTTTTSSFSAPKLSEAEEREIDEMDEILFALNDIKEKIKKNITSRYPDQKLLEELKNDKMTLERQKIEHRLRRIKRIKTISSPSDQELLENSELSANASLQMIDLSRVFESYRQEYENFIKGRPSFFDEIPQEEIEINDDFAWKFFQKYLDPQAPSSLEIAAKISSLELQIAAKEQEILSAKTANISERQQFAQKAAILETTNKSLTRQLADQRQIFQSQLEELAIENDRLHKSEHRAGQIIPRLEEANRLLTQKLAIAEGMNQALQGGNVEFIKENLNQHFAKIAEYINDSRALLEITSDACFQKYGATDPFLQDEKTKLLLQSQSVEDAMKKIRTEEVIKKLLEEYSKAAILVNQLERGFDGRRKAFEEMFEEPVTTSHPSAMPALAAAERTARRTQDWNRDI